MLEFERAVNSLNFKVSVLVCVGEFPFLQLLMAFNFKLPLYSVEVGLFLPNSPFYSADLLFYSVYLA